MNKHQYRRLTLVLSIPLLILGWFWSSNINKFPEGATCYQDISDHAYFRCEIDYGSNYSNNSTLSIDNIKFFMEDYQVLIRYDGREYKSNLSKLANNNKFCRIKVASFHQKNTIEFECDEGDEGDLEFRSGELKFISKFEQNDLINTFNSIERKLETQRTLFKILLKHQATQSCQIMNYSVLLCLLTLSLEEQVLS